MVMGYYLQPGVSERSVNRAFPSSDLAVVGA
jgi:hypothetical protein